MGSTAQPISMVELSLCCLTQCSFLSCESNKYIFRPLVLYVWLQFITLCTKNKYNSKIRFTIDSTDKRMKIHAWSIRKYWISMELCHHQYWLHWGVFWPQICQIFNSKFKISLIIGKLQPCGFPQAEVYPQEQEWPIDWSSGGTTASPFSKHDGTYIGTIVFQILKDQRIDKGGWLTIYHILLLSLSITNLPRFAPLSIVPFQSSPIHLTTSLFDPTQSYCGF